MQVSKQKNAESDISPGYAGEENKLLSQREQRKPSHRREGTRRTVGILWRADLSSGEGEHSPRGMALRGDAALKDTAALHGPAEGSWGRAARGAAPGRLRAGLGVPLVPNHGAHRLLASHRAPGESGSLNTHLEPPQMKMNY